MRLLRNMNTKLNLDSFYKLIHGNKKRVEEFYTYIRTTSHEVILAKIDFNTRSKKFHQSLFEFFLTSKKYHPLAEIILERIPAYRFNLKNMKRSDVKKLATILVKRNTSFLIEKLKNIAGFNLNATYNRKQNTLFCKIVKLAKARPDVLIDILSTIELENIDFNEIQKNKYNDTVLSSIFKIAVEMQTPAVIDTLLHFAPFRKLDFVTAKKYAFSLQSKNIIDWLSTTKYADSIPKIFEAGIRQGRKIWEALVKKLDDIEVYNRNFIIFKDHFIKLEDFAHCAQHQQCNTLLSEFYQYILTETNNENPNLSALRNLVQNFSEAIKEKKNDLQLLNDFCNTIACENSYFRKEIALTFAYRCNRERSSTCEYDEPLESLINIKTPVSTDDKKFLLDALIAMREIEDLKSLPCSTKKMVRIKEEKIQDNLVILNNIEKTMASISL